MKVLIWFACVFVASIVKTLLVGSGSLGAIPTMILYGAAFAAAKALSTAWENRKNDGKADNNKDE